MILLKKIYYFLVFTNILIALAAAAQCALTYLIFDRPYNPYIIAIEGAATLLLYNSSLLLAKPKDPAASKYARIRWVFRYKWLMWANMFLAFCILCYALTQVHPYTLCFLLGIGFFSLLYSFPIVYYKGHWVGLRQLPALKVFHIALIWTLSSVALPAVELIMQGAGPELSFFINLFIFKFIFLLVCTLPFDIRDIAQDSYYHLKTIPSILGAEKAIRLCYYLLALHSLLLLFSVLPLPIKMGILSCNLMVGLILRFFVFKHKGHYHYTYLLDMALVLQFLLVWAAVFILSPLQ